MIFNLHLSLCQGLETISTAFAGAIDGSQEGTNILPVNLVGLTPGSARRPTSLTNSWRFGLLLIGHEAGEGVGPVKILCILVHKIRL
jgi:hypothetical protein